MTTIIASAVAGLFIALAAVLQGNVLVLLLLSASAFGAYLSHLPEPYWLRLLGHWGGLGLGLLAWVLLFIQLL